MSSSEVPEIVEPRRSRNHLRRSFWRQLRRNVTRLNRPILLISVLALIAIVVIAGLIIITDAQNRLHRSWATLARVVATLNSTPGNELTYSDFERLQATVQDFRSDLETTRNQIAVLRPLVGPGSDQAASLKVLDAAFELALASEDVLAGLEPTLFFLASGETDENVVLQISSGERVVDLLNLGNPRFLSGSEHLSQARSTIDDLALDSASPGTLILAQGLHAYHAQLEAIIAVLLDAPDLLTLALGLDEDQSYLVLAQNNDEIRPSGGYISTYGWMVVHNGRVVDYDYSPTTTTSPTPPSNELVAELTIPDWWLQFDAPIYAAWDGSWYADFSSTAEMAAWYYNSGDNPQTPVDGVIAIDITGFEYLLEGLDSVTVEGYDEEVTPENFRDVVYAIRAGTNDEERSLTHKYFLAALYRQIMANWQETDRERGPEMFGAALRALQEKHILFYFADERLNRAVQTLGWAGTQESATAHDYLMIADANLGNKSNHSITRQLLYDVALQLDNTLESKLTLVYDYSALNARNDPAIAPAHYNRIDYFNLLQVFTPAGSTLLSSDDLWNIPDSETTQDHTNFIALTLVAYNTAENFNLAYTTPPVIEQFGSYRRYRLLIQKQPGTHNDPVTVQVRLPDGAQLVDSSPEPAAIYRLEQEVLEFRTTLATDLWIEVIYSVD